MAQARKFANLPDLDTEAPDVYETPELTEDATTAVTSTTQPRSPSYSSGDSDSNDESRVDRHKLNTDQARTRFGPAKVDARNTDFSDRLPPHKRSYKTSTYRKRRGGGTGSETELGDFSDEEDESLERKLARLRREVEEVKSEFERVQQNKAQAAEGKEAEAEVEDPGEDIRKLSDALNAVYVQRHGVSNGAEAHFRKTLEKFSSESSMAASKSHKLPSPPTIVALPKQQQDHILAKAAEFDQRLTQLEEALGLNAFSMPDTAEKPPKPILHTLGDLEHQIHAISSTNPTTIEAVGAKVRRLNQEAQDAPAPSQRDAAANGEGAGSYVDDPDRVAKINALYGILPTIQSLSPTLPMVLERLRTLRMIHASAGTANATLDGIEKRQAEQAGELKQWREALEKMEQKLDSGEEVLTNNVKLVGEWVRELEARVTKFS